MSSLSCRAGKTILRMKAVLSPPTPPTQLACGMPVRQSQPNKGVPPLMGAPDNIKCSRSDTLRELGDVEEKGQQEKEVEDNNPWEEDLDLMAVKAIHKCPVKGRDEAVDDEG